MEPKNWWFVQGGVFSESILVLRVYAHQKKETSFAKLSLCSLSLDLFDVSADPLIERVMRHPSVQRSVRNSHANNPRLGG